MMCKYPARIRGFIGRETRGGILLLFLAVAMGCAAMGGGSVYKDPNMDFSLIQTVAVMPVYNLSKDTLGGERFRDVFMTTLFASGNVYVVPPGEVSRGISRAGLANPPAPTPEEVVKFSAAVRADVVIVGTLKEYGEVRSGTSSANAISVSLLMMEAQTGKVVWEASTTQGGITFTDRLFGGGGVPMNVVTEKAANDLIDKLFR